MYQVPPTQKKAQSILSDTTVRRSAIDREVLKPYWNSEKDHIFLGDQQDYYLPVFQNFTEHGRRRTGWQFLVVHLSPTFVNTGTTDVF